MSKTYSVTVQRHDGAWITNWDKYFDLDEINWTSVTQFCKERGYLAFGYQYGGKSNQQTSARTRTVLAELLRPNAVREPAPKQWTISFQAGAQ